MPDLITEMADYIESLNGSGRVFTLRIAPGDSPSQRMLLIDRHAAVLGELRRRGHDDVRATVTRISEGELDPDGMPLPAGEHLAIGFAPDDDDMAGL